MALGQVQRSRALANPSARRLVVFILAAVYFLRQLRKQLVWARLPCPPSIRDWAHPLFGQFIGILLSAPRIPIADKADVMGIYIQAAKQTAEEGLFRVSFLKWWWPIADTLVVVHDIKLVRQVLSKDSWGLYKKGNSYWLAHDLIGSRGLLVSPDNDLWKEQRRIISAAFRKRMLDTLVIPSVRRSVDELVARLKTTSSGGGVLEADLAIEGNRLTIDVLGKFAFGFDFGATKGGGEGVGDRTLAEEFACVLSRMANYGENPLLLFTKFLPTKANNEYRNAIREVNAAVNGAINSRMEQRRKGEDFGEDLLGQLLKAEEVEGTEVDRTLLLENLRTVLFAGHDTTASALAYLCHLLATHPDEQEAVSNECISLGSGPPDTDALEGLPRLDAAIKETLRLYPSAGFTRAPIEDINIGGHGVPAGTEVFVFPYLTMRDERLFENADRFKPDRWMAVAAEDGSSSPKGSSPERMGWCPFSLGARNCVGSRLALLELKAVAHTLLTRFSLSVPEGAVTPLPVLYMTLVPHHVPIIFKPRA